MEENRNISHVEQLQIIYVATYPQRGGALLPHHK